MWDNSCASFRWIGYVDLEISRVKNQKILKNPMKINDFRGFSDKTLNKFIKEIVDFENFSIFHTRDLEIYITNPPETCAGVVPHALVCAKKCWGIVLTPNYFKSTFVKKRSQKCQKN